MPIQYKPSPYAYCTTGDSLTEPEHKDSCDINKMIANILRGLDVHGGGSLTYGYDDVTMDGVQYRILKEKTEAQLQKIAAETEFSDEEIKHVHPDVQKKFKFKTKAPKKNDDQTTPTPAPRTEPPKPS